MDEKSADCDFDFNKVSTDLSRELVVEWKKKIHVVGTGRSCCFNRSGVDVSKRAECRRGRESRVNRGRCKKMILSVTCAPVCCTTETSVVNMTKIFVPRLNGGDTLLSQAFLP